MSIDFSKAPEGATHCLEVAGGVLYYREKTSWLELWDEDLSMWVKSRNSIGGAVHRAIVPMRAFKQFISVEDAPTSGSPTYTPEQLEWAASVSTKFDHLSGPERALAIAQFVIGGEIDKAEKAMAGRKHDSGKPLIGAVPPNALLAVAKVITFGAEKYGRDNWRQVENAETRYLDAALRHINSYQRGELADPESGESHLAHAVCSLMFTIEMQESK